VISVARKVWQQVVSGNPACRARRAGEPDRSGQASAAQVAAAFAAAPPDCVTELLETLVTLGQARQTAEGRFVG